MEKFKILVSVDKINSAMLEYFDSQGIGLELSYFSLPWRLGEKTLKSDIQRHKEMLKGFKQERSLHGAFYGLNPTARDPLLVGVCRYRIMQSLDIATELEMDKVVFHANYIPSNHSDYQSIWTKKQVSFWGGIIPRLEELGIRIFIENTREENAGYIGNILSELNHPLVSTCYDTGHSSCFTRSKLPVTDWVRGYGKHLGYIHLHSNDSRTDQHIAFHQGKQSFDGFFDAVQEQSPLPYLIVEVKTRAAYLASMKELKRIGIFEGEVPV